MPHHEPQLFGMVTCASCKEPKPAMCFRGKPDNKSGLHHNCRVCEVEKVRQWRIAKKDKKVGFRKVEEWPEDVERS